MNKYDIIEKIKSMTYETIDINPFIELHKLITQQIASHKNNVLKILQYDEILCGVCNEIACISYECVSNCDGCEKVICENCTNHPPIKSHNGYYNYCIETYCDECFGFYESDTESEISIDYDNISDNEEIQIERKNELITNLQNVGCKLRSDSRLCEEYIRFGQDRIDCSHVVQIMEEMKFYFDETTYSIEYNDEKENFLEYKGHYDIDEISEFAKHKALSKWCKQYKNYNDAIKCKKLPKSLHNKCKNIYKKMILLQSM